MLIKTWFSMTFSIFALVLFAAGNSFAQTAEIPLLRAEIGKINEESFALGKQLGRGCYVHGQTRAALQIRLDSLRKIRQLRRAQAVEANGIETHIAHLDQVCDVNLR